MGRLRQRRERTARSGARSRRSAPACGAPRTLKLDGGRDSTRLTRFGRTGIDLALRREGHAAATNRPTGSSPPPTSQQPETRGIMDRETRWRLEEYRRNEAGPFENAFIDDVIAGEFDRRELLRRASVLGI